MTTADPALDHLRDAATTGRWDAAAATTLMTHLSPDPTHLVTKEHLDLRLAAEFAALRCEMHRGIRRQTKWLVGTMVGSMFAFGSLSLRRWPSSPDRRQLMLRSARQQVQHDLVGLRLPH